MIKAIYLLFLTSGITSLTYQIIWVRKLSLIFGSTTYATGVIISAFMAGLAIGSYFLGKKFDNHRSPVLIYGLLELIIAIYALVSLKLFAASDNIYAFFYRNYSSNFLAITILRIIISFALLLIPTILMGGTLPVLSKYIIKHTKQIGEKLGILYSINTAGACIGSFASTFILIGWLGVSNTLYLSVFINLLVAIAAIILNQKIYNAEKSNILQKEYVSDEIKTTNIENQKLNSTTTNSRLFLLLFFLSGFAAMAAEVLWIRIFTPFTGTSIYSYTFILLIFLIGISIGSYLYKTKSNKISDSAKTLIIIELFIALLTLLILKLPGWLDNLAYWLLSNKHLTNAILINVLILALLFTYLLIITICYGFIFPLFSKIIINKTNNITFDIGRVYAVNTFGNIFGSFICSFFMIQFLGVAYSLIFIALISFIISILLVCKNIKNINLTQISMILLFSIFLFIYFPSYSDYKQNFFSIFPGKLKNIYPWNSEIYYYKEDIDATIAAYNIPNRNRKGLLVNGDGMTVLTKDTKLLAHLPIWLTNGASKNFLNICFGMGTTFNSTFPYKNMNIETVEIIRSVYNTFKYFHPENQNYLTANNVKTIYGDGANYIKLTNKKYDVITLDPAPPIYAFGTVNLYSLEFYKNCNAALTDNGIMCQWLTSGGQTLKTFKMLIKTFVEVWPNTIILNSPNRIGVILLGSKKAINIEQQDFTKFLENQEIQKDLNEFGIWHLTNAEIKNYQILKNNELQNFLKNAEIITEDRPLTEFPLNDITDFIYGKKEFADWYKSLQ